MISDAMIYQWLVSEDEDENIEFKEAKSSFDSARVLKYCAAIANEEGGYFVLGVSDKKPRKVVGSNAFSNKTELNRLKKTIVQKLNIRVESYEISYNSKRILVFEVPSRVKGHPIAFEGAYLMRSGESLVAMTPDKLKRIFDEGNPDWLLQPALSELSDDEVISVIDTQGYFDLLQHPYPTNRDSVLKHLLKNKLIKHMPSGWVITNLAALTLAKNLENFPGYIANKASRYILYDGTGKYHTQSEKFFTRGYAVGFEEMVNYIHEAAPQNEFIEEVIREEVKMFPRQALRELIANALIHQDFLADGIRVMIEMYDDRIEISNPGSPSISLKRFIDESNPRNEVLATLMRHLGICEEKGSGIDKVIRSVESYQLPAPDFRKTDIRTSVLLFAHQDFSDMSKSDRIRACYQHCCLMYVNNQAMTNQSLRERFGVSGVKQATVSTVISSAKKREIIKVAQSDSSSTRYAKYIPFWA